MNAEVGAEIVVGWIGIVDDFDGVLEGVCLTNISGCYTVCGTIVT